MSRPMLAQKIKKLVSEVPLGSCIVELGTHLGKSTVLYHSVVGNKIDIFTIDDFDSERINWLGQALDANDELIFYENIKKANARIMACRMKIEDVVKVWFRAIGLLSWDIGQSGRFRRDFEDWSKFIIANGVAIVKDMPSNTFGTSEVIDELIDSSAWERFDYWNGISFLRRTGGLERD